MRASSRATGNGTPLERRQDRGASVSAMSIDHAFVRIMRQAVAAILLQNKIEGATMSALDILGNLAAMHMNEICRRTRLLVENSGRSKVTAHDIEFACRDLEISIGDLCDYIQRFLIDPNYPYLPEPRTVSRKPQEAPMHIGEPAPRPSHVLPFLPPFPDPHTYIRTPINIEPDVSYVRHRELCAKNKRDTDYTLITYFTTKHPTISLFRKYEEEVRAEVKEELRRREERRKERIEARILAARRKRLEKDLSEMPTNGTTLPEDFLEEDDPAVANGVGNDDLAQREAIEKEIELEELTEVQVTENSLIRQRLRPAYQILLPFDDDRPYLNALLPPDFDEQKEREKEQQQEEQVNPQIYPDMLTSDPVDIPEKPKSKSKKHKSQNLSNAEPMDTAE
ncbi:unnamed protein product [Bursaphelenchus xylophilus]|uniref:Transcription initiation factor TFIID subunit 8 n=1 Tax=Bursaphelenchus xylophilus TaxID=6326 RepID=A0A1I7SIP6_BURXY|nr:unnamed protein product [Bursaphelenchus xylophilus]CAG9116780.1 unnamed protein product [Bursaphelenchus xylophilus]